MAQTGKAKTTGRSMPGPIVRRSQEEIDAQLNSAAKWFDQGGTASRSATYEQGVTAAINWLLGDADEWPIQEEPED